MGVVNCTPDSFSDGGLYHRVDKAVDHALELVEAGADIIDIGGESTRPFADPVPVEEEIRRVVPVIMTLRQKTDKIISIDTQKADVAREALMAGADMVNDVSALRADSEMASVIKAFNCMVCIMHMQGTPKNMQLNPRYRNCLEEVYSFLEERLDFVRRLGIAQEKIIIDPGIGFGKRLEHNLELLANLKHFKKLKAPLLVGLSRKTFLGEITGIKEPQKRDVPTMAGIAWAILHGADIVRVHNVEWTRQVLEVVSSISSHTRQEMAASTSAPHIANHISKDLQDSSKGCSN